MHKLYCPVAMSNGLVIETGVGVGNTLVDMSRENGSIVINIDYYRDVSSVKNAIKGIKGKSPLTDIVHSQANIHQAVCYLDESQVSRAVLAANDRLTQFLEELWGFWNVEDLDAGIFETKSVSEGDSTIKLPAGFEFTGVRVMNADSSFTYIETASGQTELVIDVEGNQSKIVQYKAKLG